MWNLLRIWVESREKVPSIVYIIMGLMSSCICVKSHPGHWNILCYQMILFVDNEGPYQTAQMRSLIWAFAVRICPKTCFLMTRLICRWTAQTQSSKDRFLIDLDKTGLLGFRMRTEEPCLFGTIHMSAWLMKYATNKDSNQSAHLPENEPNAALTKWALYNYIL